MIEKMKIIKEDTQRLREIIQINREETTMYKMKKRCAPDDRIFSVSIGILGIAGITFPFAFSFTFDLLSLLRIA